LGSLVIVIGLMLLLLYFIRKAGLAKTGIQQNQLINIIDTRMVAPKKQVAVLKIGDEYIVVGITEQNINLLTTIENNAVIDQAIAASPNANGAASFSFAHVLNKAIGKDKKTTQDIIK
jgi:flagellar protein FliO/FliZ